MTAKQAAIKDISQEIQRGTYTRNYLNHESKIIENFKNVMR